MYDSGSWGGIDPDEKPRDTHRAYPATHSDTLVPAVKEAVTHSRKAKHKDSVNDWIRRAAIAGSLLGGLWLFSVLGSLSSRQAVSSPQIQLEPVAPIETPAPNEPPPLSDLTSRRSNAWEQVRQACGIELQSTASETRDAIRIARADSWILYAKQECDRNKNCQSPYDWLRQQHDSRGARLQELASADRLSIRAEYVVEFLQNLSDLQDIGTALQQGVNARAMSWVPTDKLSDRIDDCSNAAKRFESLTRASVEEAQALPGGDFDAF